MSYRVTKRASSGVWDGEVIATFESLKRASDYLNMVADDYEKDGFNIDDKQDENGNVVWLEATHDNIADAYFYKVIGVDNDGEIQGL